MATLTKQYTFAPGTRIQSSEVNANFDRLFTFINNDLVHRDASKAFTGVPLLPGVDPTNANHAARKAYVDSQKVAAQSYASTLYKAGNNAAATSPVGDFVIGHDLGKVPKAAILTPATMRDANNNPNVVHGWYPTIENMDAQNLNVRIFSTTTGEHIPSTWFIIHWAVFA